MRIYVSIFCLVLFWVLVSVGYGDDWPQFRGINRDGKSAESGLLKKWPEGGPKLLYTVEGLGKGWSSASIVQGRMYTSGLIDKTGHVFAHDLKGKLLWKSPYGAEYMRNYQGARSQPTVDEGRLYVISGLGVISCLETETGKKLWEVDTFEKFGGRQTRWGIHEAALVVDDKVICTPGSETASMVALDKKTGATIWKTKGISDLSAFCSPILIKRGDRRIIVTQLEFAATGVDPDTGEVLWRDVYAEYKKKTNPTFPVSPVYYDGGIFTTCGFDAGGAMIQLSPDGTKITRPWIGNTLDTYFQQVVEVDGCIYGANYHNTHTGGWVCLDFKTGKVMYETDGKINKGGLIYADGMLYCVDDRKGVLYLVPATPDGFNPVSSFHIPEGSGTYWSIPVISDGRMYLRHGDTMMVYDIKEK
ncbi:PQQ-binding-like beta-propeller repeat protein [Planctomycetota bacterium]